MTCFSLCSTGLIHGDFHDENLLHLQPHSLQSHKVPQNYTSVSLDLIPTDPKHSYGLIDFMDMSHSASVCDLAIALAFVMIGVGDNCGSTLEDDFISSGGHLLAGYISHRKLCPSETEALYTLVCSAYCLELVMCQHDYDEQVETNEYLLTSMKDGWRQLARLRHLGETEVNQHWASILQKYDLYL